MVSSSFTPSFFDQSRKGSGDTRCSCSSTSPMPGQLFVPSQLQEPPYIGGWRRDVRHSGNTEVRESEAAHRREVVRRRHGPSSWNCRNGIASIKAGGTRSPGIYSSVIADVGSSLMDYRQRF